MPASRTQRALTAERRSKNLQMRLAGAGWDLIAERLEYANRAAACKDFLRAMAATQAATAENAALLRQVELLRLDRLQSGFWSRALAGDAKAGRVVLDVHKARVSLLGLDATQRTLDNAVDAWLQHLGGAGMDPGDAEALAAVS
jgi:hypothetical protein